MMMKKMKTKKLSKPKEKRMKYNAENLKMALDAVKIGMSKKQASKQFQVPRSTIQFRLKNPEKPNPRPGPSSVLTDTEENVLVNWIIQSSKRGFPRRKEDIQHSVSDFLRKVKRRSLFKNDLPGDKWLKLFLRRHPEIAIRTPESVTAASSVVSESDIRSWFNGIEKYLKDNEFFDILTDPSRVLNGDETNFLLCPKTGVVLALKGDKNVYEIDRGQAKSAITVMFTFCANGDLTPPMVILPYKRLPGEIASKIPKEWGIGLSDNGWMKADLFFDYIKNVLHPYLIKEGKIFPVILFVDGHKTHLTLQVSELCSDLKIILIALYPNCTRILQPADVAAFFPLKCAWKQSVLRWRRDHPAQALTKLEFVPILKTAIKGSLKPDTIINGFRACGLRPWNADALDYTKCLGDSKGKQTDQSQPSGNDIDEHNQMTKDDFINIVGKETINKLNRKDLNTIHDASKLLQSLWIFFSNSLSTTNESENRKTPDFSRDSLLEEQLDIDNMPVVLSDDFMEFNNELEVNSSYGSYLPSIPEIPIQETVIIPHREGNIEEKAFDTYKKETSVGHDPVVPSQPSSNKIYNIQDVVMTANMITSAQKTPCKLNLTPVNLSDILVMPATPKRKGTKHSEKTPFVLTSEEWQRINTEKIQAKELKEEGIKRRRLEREQKKYMQKDKKQNKGKGKGKGKGKEGTIQNVKKYLFSEKFHLPDAIDIQANEKENISQNIENTAGHEINKVSIYESCDDDNIVPSTSAGRTNKGFTATEIFEILADSDIID